MGSLQTGDMLDSRMNRFAGVANGWNDYVIYCSKRDTLESNRRHC